MVIKLKSSSSVIISWTPPSIPNGIIRGYNIYEFIQNSSSKVWNVQGGDSVSYKLQISKNFSFGKTIRVQVSSYTKLGEGPKSRIMNITTGG